MAYLADLFWAAFWAYYHYYYCHYYYYKLEYISQKVIQLVTHLTQLFIEIWRPRYSWGVSLSMVHVQVLQAHFNIYFK